MTLHGPCLDDTHSCATVATLNDSADSHLGVMPHSWYGGGRGEWHGPTFGFALVAARAADHAYKPADYGGNGCAAATAHRWRVRVYGDGS